MQFTVFIWGSNLLYNELIVNLSNKAQKQLAKRVKPTAIDVIVYFSFFLAEIFELISKAQANRMDDQRGELKGRLELPDFLKLPDKNLQVTSQAARSSEAAPAMNPGQRPVVRKSMSSPVNEQMDFMNELAAKLARRTGTSGKEHPRIEQSAKKQDKQEDNRAGQLVRPRSSTDLAVLDSSNAESERRAMPRSPRSQPVTVNSLRGMHAYGSAFRQRSGDLSNDVRTARTGGNTKLHGMQKYTSRSSQHLNSREVTRAAPAVYDVKPGWSQPETSVRQPIKSNPAHRGMITAYSLPEVNTHKVEVHIPREGKPKVPFRKPAQQDRRPRPRPITDPEGIIAGLESSLSSPGPHQTALSSEVRVTSPLPPAPSPPSACLADLEIANFSPPTPLSVNSSPCVSPQAHSVNSVRTPSPDPNVNKTLTPASNDRTFVGETVEHGTPWVPNRGSVSKRVISPGSAGLKERLRESEKRRSKEEKEVVPLDPYVTYEDQDLRVTFV